MTDIICFSTTDWDEIWGSRQQIMKCLARSGHRILFIERQVGPEHILRDPVLRKRKFAAWRRSGLRFRLENLWLYQPPLMPPGRYYSPVLNKMGQQWLARKTRRLVATLGFNNPILWMYPPHSAPLISHFNESLAVYHCIDRFAGAQTGRKRQVILDEEVELLKKSDIVFTHSEGLSRLYAPFTKHKITVVPSAADVAHFQSTGKIHPDVASLPKPRLGLEGTLDGRIDVSMLVSLATEHPEWQLVLIGQARPGRVDLTSLISLPNVHLLGNRPFDQLPLLLNGMDVLLIPYVRNELTEYISPIKLFEYLAVGKPIVTVALPEVKIVKEWISIVENLENFGWAIELAMQTDSPALQAARRQAAWEHTWEARAQRMWRVIQEALEETSDAQS